MDSSLDHRRRYRVSFRTTAAERQALNAAAERSGHTLSDFARAVLLQAKPARRRRPAVETVLLARVLARLGVIAVSLGDIATLARCAGAEITLMPSIERELASQLRALAPCRSQLLRGLGRKAASV